MKPLVQGHRDDEGAGLVTERRVTHGPITQRLKTTPVQDLTVSAGQGAGVVAGPSASGCHRRARCPGAEGAPLASRGRGRGPFSSGREGASRGPQHGALSLVAACLLKATQPGRRMRAHACGQTCGRARAGGGCTYVREACAGQACVRRRGGRHLRAQVGRSQRPMAEVAARPFWPLAWLSPSGRQAVGPARAEEERKARRAAPLCAPGPGPPVGRHSASNGALACWGGPGAPGEPPRASDRGGAVPEAARWWPGRRQHLYPPSRASAGKRKKCLFIASCN